MPRKHKPGPGETFLRSIPRPWPANCIDWPLSLNPVHGYGQVVFQRKKMYLHRAAALLYIGAPADPTLEVAHSCGNRKCCNPGHLRWATRASNHADKRRHGTMLQGDTHPNARLTAGKVMVARALASQMTHEQIARRFGVSRAAISLAIEHKTWKHVPELKEPDL